MLTYKGVNIFKNEYLQKDRFVAFDKGLMMHPYSMGRIILNGLNKSYIDVFSCIGIDEHSIDVCIDFAKQKLKKYISNH